MQRPLLCLRSQSSAPLGIVEPVLVERGVAWRYADLWREPSLPALGEVCGLVVLGGAMNVDAVDRHTWLAPVRELVAEAVAAELPVLGICLGAQVLTRALGAAVLPGVGREIGFRPLSVTAAGARDPLASCFAPAARVFQFHEDSCELPDEAELLAFGSDVAVQAFRTGGRAYGFQFHLEVTEREVAAWCDEVGDDELRGVWGVTREQLLDDARRHLPAQQAAGAALTHRFVDLL